MQVQTTAFVCVFILLYINLIAKEKPKANVVMMHLNDTQHTCAYFTQQYTDR